MFEGRVATRLLKAAEPMKPLPCAKVLYNKTAASWYEGTQNDVSMKPLLFQATEPGERDNRRGGDIVRKYFAFFLLFLLSSSFSGRSISLCLQPNDSPGGGESDSL